MINADMRLYNYFTLGEQDEYGQQVISNEPVGQVKMAINISSQAVQDNINYIGATYVGLTHAKVDDTFVIEYGEERLKVLYVNNKGRLNQVFMASL
jgi:hypothetical protein